MKRRSPGSYDKKNWFSLAQRLITSYVQEIFAAVLDALTTLVLPLFWCVALVYASLWDYKTPFAEKPFQEDHALLSIANQFRALFPDRLLKPTDPWLKNITKFLYLWAVELIAMLIEWLVLPFLPALWYLIWSAKRQMEEENASSPPAVGEREEISPDATLENEKSILGLSFVGKVGHNSPNAVSTDYTDASGTKRREEGSQESLEKTPSEASKLLVERGDFSDDSHDSKKRGVSVDITDISLSPIRPIQAIHPIQVDYPMQTIHPIHSAQDWDKKNHWDKTTPEDPPPKKDHRRTNSFSSIPSSFGDARPQKNILGSPKYLSISGSQDSSGGQGSPGAFSPGGTHSSITSSVKRRSKLPSTLG